MRHPVQHHLAALAAVLLVALLAALAGPRAASADITFSSVAVGDHFSCGVVPDASVRCWGHDNFESLGNGDGRKDSQYPSPVGDLGAVVQLSVHKWHSCAVVTSAGQVRCWGYGNGGVLGPDINSDSALPLTVGGLPAIKEVAVGSIHACALSTAGAVWCWGNSLFNQTGRPASSGNAPGALPGIAGARAVTAGDDHTCAILGDGTVRCWGRDTRDQTGAASGLSTATPTAPAGLGQVSAIAAGNEHTCAIEAGLVRCWGAGSDGQLGDGATVYATATPVTAAGIAGATAIAAGKAHTCAVLADGTVRCWGANDVGQLGSGTTTKSTVPVTVSGISSAVAVSAGESHSCALLRDGSAWCWGSNLYGELTGDGDSRQTTPIRVMDGPPAPPVAPHLVAEPISGTVRFRTRTGTSTALTGRIEVANDTTFDARHGRMRLIILGGGPPEAVIATGEFAGGRFTLTRGAGQAKATLRLARPAGCAASRAALPHMSKRRSTDGGKTNRLDAREQVARGGRGAFRTIGGYSSAAAIGTDWTTTETCRATRVTVREGRVRVRDLVRGRTVTVTAGRSYQAVRRTPRPSSARIVRCGNFSLYSLGGLIVRGVGCVDGNRVIQRALAKPGCRPSPSQQRSAQGCQGSTTVGRWRCTGLFPGEGFDLHCRSGRRRIHGSGGT